MKARLRPWLTGLGWDVGQHEVIIGRRGLFVRLFRSRRDAEPYYTATVQATEPVAAVQEARQLSKRR